MRHRSRWALSRERLISLLAIVAALSLLIPAGVLAHHKAGHQDASAVDIQFLNISDWHGQLDPTSGVGGAAVLSAYFQADRAANPNTLTLTAGDDIGATPPLSNFFDDVPAILAQRLMGIQVGTFGNHNFDRGIDHLQCMIDIAGAPHDSSFEPDVYDADPCEPTSGGPGNAFSYVSANLRNRDDNLSGVENWKIFTVGGIKVGVVGLTNEEAPTLVFPGSFGTIEITDSVRAANKARAEMKKAGAQILVAITHKGIRGFDGDGNAFGELIDFANAVGGYDLIFGDHTDFNYSGVHGKAFVSENRSKGLTYSKTQLTVDPKNGRVISRSFESVTPTAAAVTPDPAIVAMLQPYRDAVNPILGTVIGSATKVIPRSDSCGNSDGRLCESLVGNTVTDSMRLTYGTDFSITNSGGLRANLTCPTAGGGAGVCPAYTPPPFLITRGQVLTVLPFGNIAATLTLNGAELKSMLEQGVSSMPGANGRFAQVSGLCFTYNVEGAVGSRVTSVVRQASNGTCTGPAVDLTAASSYSLATNDFMANGGDGYPNFSARMVTRDIMDNVLADYVTANSPVDPSIQGRIVCFDPNPGSGNNCPAITAP